jgi:5'(3')-deoxyribonucleotidase
MALVAIDVDGVLADFVRHLCDAVKADHGHEVAPCDIRHWDLSKSMSERAHRAACMAMREPGFCYEMPAYVGARACVEELRKVADVVALTSPLGSSTWIPERLAWLADVCGFRSADVVFCPTKHKAAFAADVLVEDHAGIVADWADRHAQGAAVLIDRAWNRPGAAEHRPHRRVVRAPTFADVVHLATKAVTS